MGTHNLLLRLGNSVFLEVISPNPEAPPPARPRWFALDTLCLHSPPALATWVARTGDLHGTAPACSEALGDIEPMSRGALNWRMTIPGDGALPLDGIAPALIEWETQTHPAAKLQDYGLSLVKLELFHPEPERISRLLQSIGFAGEVSVLPPGGGRTACLLAHIATPQGLRVL